MIPNPERPYSFATLLKLYLRGLLDLKTLMIYVLENLVDQAETQQAHTTLIEMMSEATGEHDQDIEALARLVHLSRPSRGKRGEAGLWSDQNGSTGPDQADDNDEGSDDEPPTE